MANIHNLGELLATNFAIPELSHDLMKHLRLQAGLNVENRVRVTRISGPEAINCKDSISLLSGIASPVVWLGLILWQAQSRPVELVISCSMGQQLNGIGFVVHLGLTKDPTDTEGAPNRKNGPEATKVTTSSVDQVIEKVRVIRVQVGQHRVVGKRGCGHRQGDLRAGGSSMGKKREDQPWREPKELVAIHHVWDDCPS